jgi:hypothetical protein
MHPFKLRKQDFQRPKITPRLDHDAAVIRPDDTLGPRQSRNVSQIQFRVLHSVTRNGIRDVAVVLSADSGDQSMTVTGWP